MSTRRVWREWLPWAGLLASLPPLYLWGFGVHVVRVWTDERIVEPLSFQVGDLRTVVAGLEPGTSHYVLIYGFNQHDSSMKVLTGPPDRPSRGLVSCGYETSGGAPNYEIWLSASGDESRCREGFAHDRARKRFFKWLDRGFQVAGQVVSRFL
ncbi:MAG: hypothetical protein EOO72_09695 [Myxococcaceae bacterium]|nr:MAG: hypothetical protein EOO72_09695 [Myxococcaceae bacterium]